MTVSQEPSKRSLSACVQTVCVGALAATASARHMTSLFGGPQKYDLFEAAVRNNASKFVTQRAIGAKPVCIVDLHMPADRIYAKLATKNHRDYAAWHDYSYLGFEGLVAGDRFAGEAPRNSTGSRCRVHCGGVYFQKLGAMAAAAMETDPLGKPLCETLMWMDTDAVFTNFHVPIEAVTLRFPDRTPQAKDVILSRENTLFDTSFVNSGVFVVKNTPLGRDFLEGSAALFEKHNVGGDQNAIQEYAFGVDPRGRNMTERSWIESQLRPEIGLVDQKVMNAFTWQGDPLAKGSTAASEWEPCDYIAHIASRTRRDRRGMLEKVIKTAETC